MKLNDAIKTQVESDSLVLEQIVNDIVSSYTKELDDYVDKIKKAFSLP